jgi:peptidyl-prolyl cis-trans isomerase SurA
MKMTQKNLIVLFACLLGITGLFAQDDKPKGQVIDEVVAVVGKNVILYSDIQTQYIQYRMQGGISGTADEVRCSILENMLYQKLLLDQADLDSVEVTEKQVDAEMERRLAYFIQQIGSKEKLEEYYKKSMADIREEMKEVITEQMMTDQVQRELTANVMITPSQVRKWFRSLPKDSIPMVEPEVSIGQIVRQPEIDMAQKIAIKEKLRALRKRILDGETFSTLAILYSEDPGSAKKGGELGLYGRGELYPEFEAVAFQLEPGEISEIVETKAGFHILQLIERRGEYVNVRHILLRPKVSPIELARAAQFLDSVAQLIKSDSMTFEQAVRRFSDDPGRINGGMIMNPMTGTNRFTYEELNTDPKLFFVVDKLDVGELSQPVSFQTEDDTEAYRLLYLQSRSQAHRANLDDDYNKIQDWALEAKKAKHISEWVQGKAEKTFVRISSEFRDCSFQNKWKIKE